MSQGKVPTTADVVNTASDGQPQQLDFHPEAHSRAERFSSQYQTNLRQTSVAVAIQDDCNEVQEKHVKRAATFVCRLAPDSVSLSENYQIWWLFAGLSFAFGVALPDAGEMYISDPKSGWWTVLQWLFGILIVAGTGCAVIAYLIAMGPHQPKWFVKAKGSVAKLAKQQD